MKVRVPASPGCLASCILGDMADGAPPVQVVSDFASCHEPVKRIYTGDDIANWLESEAYARLMTVLVRCNLAIKGKRADVEFAESDVARSVVRMLDQLEEWVDDIPLHTGPQRFGNRAFKDWGERLEQRANQSHEAWLPATHIRILPELNYYFVNAFGSFVRIDYGSGHELSFLGYLTCLRYTGLLTEADEQAMVFILFERYLRVCRRLQATYRLEPAGSKGVWGLEDHQFLNFFWGSSQLVGQTDIKPSDILDASVVSKYSEPYLFMSSIAHIHRLKRGPFNEHSPILYSIATTVPSWQKVNSGLFKMYQAEVLEKHPVVQHFWFGSILPWTKRGTSTLLPSSSDTRSVPNSSEDGITGTKAPWTLPAANAQPQAMTAAPWARNTPSTVSGATAAPWASASMPQPSSGSGRSMATSIPQRSTPPQAGRSLASTGSAAAMSSPLGSILRPTAGGPGSTEPRRTLQ